MQNKDNQASKVKGKITTVDDLLTSGDVKEALDILCEKRTNYKSIIAIYVNKDDTFGWVTTDDMTNAHFIYYLEQMKYNILHETSDEE